MPKVNLYNIVTNDEYEFPIACDVRGREAVADFLGIRLTQLYRNLKSDKWRGKYKAVYVGYLSKNDDCIVNTMILPLTAEERLKRANERQYRRKAIARQKKIIEKKEYYQKNRTELLQRAKKRYRERKEREGKNGVVAE